MLIKKHPSGNEYIYSGDVWIRNLTKRVISPIQYDCLFSSSDFSLVVKNQEANKNWPKISDEDIRFEKIVIVSDGYQFEQRHQVISQMPKQVAILAINKALKKWKLLDPSVQNKRTINAYVFNNPYDESNYFQPSESNYYPVCIASIRSNHNFLKKYKGNIYTYCPTPENGFGVKSSEMYYIDDYRNPMCAAIGLAKQFGVKKLMMLCCDDSFVEKRTPAIQLDNGLWSFEQHLKVHKMNDAIFWWLKQNADRKIEIADYSSGPEYKNATYIRGDEEAIDFFKD